MIAVNYYDGVKIRTKSFTLEELKCKDINDLLPVEKFTSGECILSVSKKEFQKLFSRCDKKGKGPKKRLKRL